MVFMEACRRIADGVGNACHEDMVGWRGGIPRTEDRGFQIAWARALFVMRRDSMFAFPHRPRLRIESRGGSESYTEIAEGSCDSDIYLHFITEIVREARSNLRFDRIETMIVLETPTICFPDLAQSSCKDSLLY